MRNSDSVTLDLDIGCDNETLGTIRCDNETALTGFSAAVIETLVTAGG